LPAVVRRDGWIVGRLGHDKFFSDLLYNAVIGGKQNVIDCRKFIAYAVVLIIIIANAY
jgi:hypothetical protein